MTELQKSNRLPVTVGHTAVGMITRSEIRPEGATFRYRDRTRTADAVSLIMPSRWDAYEWPNGVHPLFQMHMPEGLLRSELTNMFSKTVRDFDEIDLLNIVGPHQLGRVRAGELDDDRFPTVSIDELKVHDSTLGLFEDLLQRYARFSGVSGVQPKVLVRDDAQSQLERLTHRGASHIVKAWREEDYPELAANEYFCMKAASYSGLETPQVNLSANNKLLIVDRFDVGPKGYLGFEDLCSLNTWPPSKKYDGSYEGCAKQLAAFLSPAQLHGGLESLFLTVALSTGVRNGDAHLKNFGVIYEDCAEGTEVRMAPAYDIVSTTPYRSKDIMALSLAGSKNWPKHKLLVDFGRRHCQLTEGKVRDLLECVADGMAKARAEMIEHIQVTRSFERIGTLMLSEWERGTERSLLPANRPVVVDMGASQSRGPRM